MGSVIRGEVQRYQRVAEMDPEVGQQMANPILCQSQEPAGPAGQPPLPPVAPCSPKCAISSSDVTTSFCRGSFTCKQKRTVMPSPAPPL